MKALVYLGPVTKTLEERPKPEITAPTDAIVKIIKTTIWGTDLHILKGDVPSSTASTKPAASLSPAPNPTKAPRSIRCPPTALSASSATNVSFSKVGIRIAIFRSSSAACVSKIRSPARRLVFLTNQITLPAVTICQLYKSRWRFELFFK